VLLSDLRGDEYLADKETPLLLTILLLNRTGTPLREDHAPHFYQRVVAILKVLDGLVGQVWPHNAAALRWQLRRIVECRVEASSYQ